MANDELAQKSNTYENLDPQVVDKLEETVRETAIKICAEQPDVPEPANLADLDSFSMVQVLLELENILDRKILERLEEFEGKSFRDLAEFIARLLAEDEVANG
ncbi:hypothetical protein [Streptomyces sp. AK010]|uniref:hypothetical protein n=1 Tax=Streptomyces sp. AK010 TaxID=2723074 RepID=UPI00161EAC63|nr:hypothetical protein [Streptomyces sp. AK010]MBB6421370.1 acyl carrier protein [Streptomyces sp. AK010]